MTRRTGTRHQGRWRWPLLGFLLVGLLLGHDALMAAGAMAAPHQPASRPHQAALPAGHQALRPTHHDAAPLLPHPEQCGVSVVALVRSPDTATRLAQLPLPIAQPIVTLERSPGWDRSATWQEPRWPPGRLRAATQVYRL